MIDRRSLQVGRWYNVQQGAALIPMQLIAWSTAHVVIMKGRSCSSKDRYVPITKIMSEHEMKGVKL